MPPTVALQQNAPRKTNLMSPASQNRAVFIIEIPNSEPAQESRQTGTDHPPHLAQNLAVAIVLTLLLCLVRWRQTLAPALQLPLLLPLAVVRTNADLHDIHRAQQHDRGQDRVSVLVERRVLQVVVVSRDEDRQARQRKTQQRPEGLLALVLEGGPEHQAGGVDHGELVDELHRVLEGGVESEAAGADDEVAHEGEQEDALMVLLKAVADAAVGQVDEQQVGEGVHDLGGVFCRIVVFLAPVEGGGDWRPVAIVARRRVGYAREYEGHVVERMDVLCCTRRKGTVRCKSGAGRRRASALSTTISCDDVGARGVVVGRGGACLLLLTRRLPGGL
jgi:hypothetical protein